MRIVQDIANVACLLPVLCHDPELRSHEPVAHWGTACLSTPTASCFQQRISRQAQANREQKLDWRVEQIFLKDADNPEFHCLVLKKRPDRRVPLNERPLSHRAITVESRRFHSKPSWLGRFGSYLRDDWDGHLMDFSKNAHVTSSRYPSPVGKVAIVRALRFALLFLACIVAAQAESHLVKVHVRVVLVDRELNQKPVPFLLVSLKNGAKAVEVKTGLEGTAETSLPPGKYAIATPKPAELGGQRFSWN